MTSRSKSLPSPERVYFVLRGHAVGYKNAIHASLFSMLLGLDYHHSAVNQNGAGYDLRRSVAEAVRAGFPICSGPSGYWVPATSAEAHLAAQALEARARKMIARAAAMRANCDRLFDAAT